MGKRSSNPVRKFFKIFDELGSKHGICEINNCTTKIIGNHAANFERHIQRFHEEEYKKLLKEKESLVSIPKKKTKFDSSQARLNADTFKCTTITNKISVQISKENLMDACVELVTKNGFPFSIIESSGFKKIINPIINGFNKKIPINTQNVKKRLNEIADELRLEIKKEIKNKMISLKLDIATCCDRSILGINCQYVVYQKIILRTLGMVEMKERHNAEYIKEIVLQNLKNYEIQTNQIYIITTDNGANMVKAMELISHSVNINLHQNLSIHENCNFDDEMSEEDVCAIDSNDQVSEEDVCEIERNLEENILMNENEHTAVHECKNNDDNFSLQLNNVLTSNRCAAHTLQLAIYDVIKENYIDKNLSKIRFICKKLRTTNILVLIKKMKYKMPKINCPTRWNSAYDMVDRLLELKDFCLAVKSMYSFLNISCSLWKIAEEFVSFFKPLKVASIKLQVEPLTIGDFYALWLELKLEIEATETENFSTIKSSLLAAIKNRETLLLNRDHIIAALYLDPRFKFLLTDDQGKTARKHIDKLGQQIFTLESSEDVVDMESDVECIENPNNLQLSALDEYLSKKEKELSLNMRLQTFNSDNLKHKSTNLNCQLNMYNPTRRNKSINILKFWHDQQQLSPELAEVAKIILAVPITQVSVERNFSVLKLILTKKRTNISEQHLENVLLCELNKKF